MRNRLLNHGHLKFAIDFHGIVKINKKGEGLMAQLSGRQYAI